MSEQVAFGPTLVSRLQYLLPAGHESRGALEVYLKHPNLGNAKILQTKLKRLTDILRGIDRYINTPDISDETRGVIRGLLAQVIAVAEEAIEALTN